MLITCLEPVPEHRTVDLVENVRAHLDMEVGADAQDVPVERGMVDLAECETVGHDRLAAGMAVRQDVRGVEELRVLQSADGALGTVGYQDLLAELGLVDADQAFLRDVGASGVTAETVELVATQDLFGVEADGERA